MKKLISVCILLVLVFNTSCATAGAKYSYSGEGYEDDLLSEASGDTGSTTKTTTTTKSNSQSSSSSSSKKSSSSSSKKNSSSSSSNKQGDSNTDDGSTRYKTIASYTKVPGVNDVEIVLMADVKYGFDTENNEPTEIYSIKNIDCFITGNAKVTNFSASEPKVTLSSDKKTGSVSTNCNASFSVTSSQNLNASSFNSVTNDGNQWDVSAGPISVKLDINLDMLR